MNRFKQLFKSKIWKRTIRNKGAVFGMIVIVFSIIVAIFCYFIAPDHSPNANRIILEIGSQKPGFRQTFALFPRDQKVEQKGFFHRLLFGQEDRFIYVPINDYELKGSDSVMIRKYIDEGVEEQQVLATTTLPKLFIRDRVVTKTFLLGTEVSGDRSQKDAYCK